MPCPCQHRQTLRSPGPSSSSETQDAWAQGQLLLSQHCSAAAPILSSLIYPELPLPPCYLCTKPPPQPLFFWAPSPSTGSPGLPWAGPICSSLLPAVPPGAAASCCHWRNRGHKGACPGWSNQSCLGGARCGMPCHRNIVNQPEGRKPQGSSGLLLHSSLRYSCLRSCMGCHVPVASGRAEDAVQTPHGRHMVSHKAPGAVAA